MSKTMEFKIFCLENYKQAHKLKGSEVVKLFKKYDVFNYITAFYDLLHSTGEQYIIEDIDMYLSSRQG